MPDLADFRHLVPLDHGLSVVVSRRADLTPHTSVVNAEFDQTMQRERRTAVFVAPLRVVSQLG